MRITHCGAVAANAATASSVIRRSGPVRAASQRRFGGCAARGEHDHALPMNRRARAATPL